jgi:hypothetical protein
MPPLPVVLPGLLSSTSRYAQVACSNVEMNIFPLDPAISLYLTIEIRSYMLQIQDFEMCMNNYLKAIATNNDAKQTYVIIYGGSTRRCSPHLVNASGPLAT